MKLIKKYILLILLTMLSFTSVFFVNYSKSKYTKNFNQKVKIGVSSYMASVTIVSDPSDADISISVDGGPDKSVQSGYTDFYNKGSVISYKVTKKHYYKKEGTYTVTTADTLTISLDPDPKRTISVVPNVPNLITRCLVNGTTLFNTTDYTKSNGIVELGDNVKCSVGEKSTYYYSEDKATKTYNPWSINITVEDDMEYTPIMNSIPKIDGSYANTDNTQNTGDFLKNYYAGWYLIELWGGKGGTGSTRGSGDPGIAGNAGHVYGMIYLDYEEEITYMLGGNGTDNTAARIVSVKNLAGGANGGGTAAVDDNYLYVGGSGGGWSTINKRIDNSIIMLAGGGGGSSGPGGTSGGRDGGNGGAGGSINNAPEYIAPYGTGTMFFGMDGGAGELGSSVHSKSIIAHGGSTLDISGTNEAYPEKSKYQIYAEQMQGTALTGGNSLGRGGGGGGGLFGGAGGFSEAADSYGGAGGHSRTSGGGGGSSFIEGYVDTNLPPSVMSKLGSNPSTKGGGLIITYLGDTKPTS